MVTRRIDLLREGMQVSVLGGKEESKSSSTVVTADTVSLLVLVYMKGGASPGTTLDVRVSAYRGHISNVTTKTTLYSFPQLTENGTEGEILLATVPAVPSSVLIEAELVTGVGQSIHYDVQVRAISGGASTTRVVAAASATTQQFSLPPDTPTLIIPASVTSGVGFIGRNWSLSGANIYLAETAAKATPSLGWPLSVGDTFDLSVKGGQEWYAYADGGLGDLRVVRGEAE